MTEQLDEPLEYVEIWLPDTISPSDPNVPLNTHEERKAAYRQMMEHMEEVRRAKREQQAVEPTH